MQFKIISIEMGVSSNYIIYLIYLQDHYISSNIYLWRMKDEDVNRRFICTNNSSL